MKDRIHRIIFRVVFHFHIGCRKHSRRKILSRCDSPLLGIRIDPDFPLSRMIVLRDQFFRLKPFPEILPHDRLKHTAP